MIALCLHARRESSWRIIELMYVALSLVPESSGF